MLLVWTYHWWFDIPLLWCPCKINTLQPTIFWDIVTTIVLENEAYVQREVFHFSPYHIWQWINIFISINSFWASTNVVITNPTHPNMVQRALSMITHATKVVIQEKTQSYMEHASRNDFIPLAIEIYGCFHSCLNLFSIYYVQTIVTMGSPQLGPMSTPPWSSPHVGMNGTTWMPI